MTNTINISFSMSITGLKIIISLVLGGNVVKNSFKIHWSDIYYLIQWISDNAF